MAIAFALFGMLASVLAMAALMRLCALRRHVFESEQARAAVARTESFCPATGLANRRRALDWLAGGQADDGPAAAIVIVIDRFRSAETEQAACAAPIAERLMRFAGDRAMVARLGSAEYLLALRGGCDPAAVIARAQAVHDALALLLGAGPGLRLGAALAAPGEAPDALVEKAEMAMGQAALSSEGSIGVLGPELERTLHSRAVQAKALAAAIAEGLIEPFYQPLVDLGSGKVLGFEVLARWREEQGRVRLPGEFVPLAEETGLVGEMYFALLRRAAAQVRRWPAEWSFTLNLSPLQFGDRRLVERTVQTLLKAGVAPGRLELEIPEAALEHDFDAARAMIEALRQQGIRVALDNFGSGRLPLRELARLDFDRLKVDGALLGSGDGKDRRAAFGLIAAAAHHLGVPVVVQGIETRAGAEQAHSQGAAIGQGFLFGRPDPQTACFRVEGALAPEQESGAAA